MQALVASLNLNLHHLFSSLSKRVDTVALLSICIALVLVIVYLLLWVASRRRRPNLQSILQPYQLTSGFGDTLAAGPMVLTVPILTAPAERMEASVTGTKFGRWLKQTLERAGVQLKPGELLMIWGVGSIIMMALGWLLAGFVGVLVVLILALAVPPAVLQVMVDKRARQFTAQLPDVLKLTSSSLRAGFSLVQGLESVSRQVREPSRSELQRVLAEARLGRPIEDAMEAAAARINNRDFSESVIAVRIQQETGGNLAALFDTLAETMVQRLRMRREVRALTAEGRLTAWILGALPPALGLFIFFVNRAYIEVLFTTTAGKAMLIGGLLLELFGFFWMFRTVKVEI